MIVLRSFLILCIFSFQLYALDIDRENINVSYLGLPSHPMVYEKDRNYSVFYNSQYNQAEFQSLIEEHFHIQGLKRFSSNAAVNIDFKFYDIEVIETEVLSKNRRIKDDEGNTRVEYYYIPIIKYKTSANIVVKYATGKSKSYKYGSKNNKHTGEEMFSVSDTDNYFNSELYQVLYRLQADFIVSSSKDINIKLNKLHGYKVVKETDYLLILDSRLYPEYKDYKRHYLLIKRLFDQMTPFDSVEGMKQELQYVISFLELIPGNYTEDKKAHTKMRYASFYNLAKIYYYLEDLEKSIDYYEKVIENDYHEGQSKRNIKAIGKLKDLLSVNRVSSRHFPIQLDLPEVSYEDTSDEAQYQQPTQQSQQIEMDGSFIYLDADMQTIDGDAIEGKIEMSDAVADVIYELQSSIKINIKFLNDNDEIELKSIFTANIESIQLTDTKLQRINYLSQSEGSNSQVNVGKVGAGELISGLAVELFRSNKISLYVYNNEIILKKANVSSGKSTSSTAFSFAFKKKLGQYLSDCSSIQADIKSGKYKNTIEGLTQAVSDYSVCGD